MQSVLEYLKVGINDGADVVAGGARVMAEGGGYFIAPTILAGLPPTSPVAMNEIFGPVVTVHPFRTIDEAISIANATTYGLTASVWTSNLNAAMRFHRELRAGTVWVNCYEASDVTSPFGGFKQSGNGRDRSLHAFDKYVEMKSTWIVSR